MIWQIEFSNTVADEEKTYFIVKNNKLNRHGNIDEIRPIMKAGEMSGVQWFQVINEGMVTAEIKESVCNVYYQDKEADDGSF